MGFSLHIYPTLPLIIALVCVLYVRSAAKWRTRSRGRPFPPGPPGLPLFGNMFNMPGDKAWLDFHELAGQYGDIIHFRIFGKSTVVLGSPGIIHEYLEKRATNTSDRVQTPVFEMLEQRGNFGIMPYGPQWRQYRRHFWQHFTSRATEQYQSIQRDAAHQFLARVLERPAQLRDHIRCTFLTTVLKVVYGVDIDEEDFDKYAAPFNVSAEGIAQALAPGKYIVELLPFLKGVPKWVPGFAWQADFGRWRAAVLDVKNVPFAQTKEAMAHGQALDSLVAKTLTAPGNADELEEMAKGIGLISYEAGADSSFIAVQSFFLAMSLHPDAQKKAQAELDRVVGNGRMPEFSDWESLVYVNAIIRETLRWHTIAPLSVSHAATDDDDLHGYFIPAGTVLLPNIWACMHDPAVYEDPHVFRPERFIRDGKLDLSVRDPLAFVFGFGRRICPGRHFAEASLFISVASILHVFDITPALDADGRPIAIKHSQTAGFISSPEDSRCTVKPRSAETAALIMGHGQASKRSIGESIDVAGITTTPPNQEVY
ncbi:cytochrome P450 [Ganoderma sinense ZZ0214-1]|uniref:Cytochrome P450 n=1 Tax=Ganoderma sinense ZZ0214-1 TaxID=1077348 RepID=A0A2G8S5X1_9APHY|nr:cytochrome P450 [Ganoderma sinense ZZ0214-1]